MRKVIQDKRAVRGYSEEIGGLFEAPPGPALCRRFVECLPLGVDESFRLDFRNGNVHWRLSRKTTPSHGEHLDAIVP